jgi:hypothetical protein
LTCALVHELVVPGIENREQLSLFDRGPFIEKDLGDAPSDREGERYDIPGCDITRDPTVLVDMLLDYRLHLNRRCRRRALVFPA